MADKKRKTTESNKTPAKKRKVEATKKTPTPAKKAKTPTPKKVTSTKVKKPDPKSQVKKTPKPSKTPAKSAKTPEKGNKSAKTPVKKAASAKPAPKKDEKKPKLADKTVTRTKLEKAKVTGMKAKLDKARALKAKAAASKAKLKSTKSAAKPKAVLKAPVKPKPKAVSKPPEKSKQSVPEKVSSEKKGKTPAKVTEKTPAKSKETKKPEEKKKDPPKKTEEKKETPKAKASDKKQSTSESVTKRKNVDADQEESVEVPRKRRMITPNKKFADFELDVPSKRTITPNKKYADFETDTSPKRVSELRAFIQDKKKSPAAETPSTSEKAAKPKAATPSVSAKKTEKNVKESPAREIKVFKPSDMKPAEKLMKKLQKKLEKEAKSASTPKPVENREKAKIKITKVVTYNKPMSSDEKEMRALKATPKSKTAPAVKTVTPSVTAKTSKQTPAKPNVSKVTKATPKATPKAKAPEKQPPKPKKIKELPRTERPIQAKFTSQKSIKFKDDNDQLNCWITGMSVFPSGEIIMVDMTNRKIKLFSKDFDFLSQVKLDTIPQDISVSPVNVSDAYFTKPFSKEGIQKVTMSDGKITLKESFWTNGTNRGITCTKSGILTSVQDGRYHDLDINHFKIDLLDYEGKVLQSVSTDSNGSRLFKLPLYFTVNTTGKQMIVADCIKHFSYVVSVDMTGKIKFKYEGIGGNLVTPRGLTIDDEDNIYVTEWERHNVYVLSPAGKRTQVLFSHQELVEDGLDGLMKPYQLCFYKEDNVNKLIVSQEGCNTVKVFQIFKKAPETEESKQAAANEVAEKKDMPNGEVSGAKRKPANQKNGSQPKIATAAAASTEGNKQAPESVKQKVVETKETVPEKKSESQEQSESPAQVAPAEEPNKVVTENTATTETAEEQNVETAETKAVPATTEEKKEESPPVLNPEFGEDFGTAEIEAEENSSVQDAINSLNDSKEEQNENETETVESGVDANLEGVVDANHVHTEVYEQISVPQAETVEAQQEIVEDMSVMQEEVQVPEAMDVQQVELVNSQYEQVIIPEEQIITTQSVDTEIQSVPMESVAHETIIIQQDVDQMNPHQYEKIETVTVNNNDASNLIQTETMQYVTDVNMPENFATSIAQSEIVTTEVPEEIVTMVTETV